MLRNCARIVALLAVVAAARPSQADWHSFWAGVERDAHRNKMWPQAFTPLDQRAAEAPFATMAAKGWQRQNLIGDHHFTEDSAKLTEAGQLRVRWILTQAPLEHRTLYIERGASAQLTAARVDATQQAAIAVLPRGELPQVLVSEMATRGWPAEQVDGIGRKYQETIPPPRLPDFKSMTGND